ncbi:MAG: hypothetical protein AAGF20_14195 [Pseudomonadota bacterium]
MTLNVATGVSVADMIHDEIAARLERRKALDSELGDLQRALDAIEGLGIQQQPIPNGVTATPVTPPPPAQPQNLTPSGQDNDEIFSLVVGYIRAACRPLRHVELMERLLSDGIAVPRSNLSQVLRQSDALTHFDGQGWAIEGMLVLDKKPTEYVADKFRSFLPRRPTFKMAQLVKMAGEDGYHYCGKTLSPALTVLTQQGVLDRGAQGTYCLAER